jgi:hypothetical protein
MPLYRFDVITPERRPDPAARELAGPDQARAHAQEIAATAAAWCGAATDVVVTGENREVLFRVRCDPPQ